MLANDLELFVDPIGSHDAGAECISEGGRDGADHAAVEESAGVLFALPGVCAAHQVVEERGRVKQGLKGGIQVARVAHVEHSGAGAAQAAVAHFHFFQGEKHDL